jgi:hypothetical protein
MKMLVGLVVLQGLLTWASLFLLGMEVLKDLRTLHALVQVQTSQGTVCAVELVQIHAWLQRLAPVHEER